MPNQAKRNLVTLKNPVKRKTPKFKPAIKPAIETKIPKFDNPAVRTTFSGMFREFIPLKKAITEANELLKIDKNFNQSTEHQRHSIEEKIRQSIPLGQTECTTLLAHYNSKLLYLLLHHPNKRETIELKQRILDLHRYLNEPHH